MTPDAESPVRTGLYIGLISGTSMDGVDAALLELGSPEVSMKACLAVPYPNGLGVRLRDLVTTARPASAHEIASLHVETGQHFADAAMRLMRSAGISASDVIAIGSHGQTLRHSSETTPAYSWQIGDPATIAARSEVTTVADFRSSDLAYGGEGAPLVPSFHARMLRHASEDRVVVNIGGIANVTLLPGVSAGPVAGFDTGPGNCLMDEWSARHIGSPFDENGRWAASGQVSDALLERFMGDPYFERLPPKSTGREAFNLRYIERHLAACGTGSLESQDVQATLLELTATTIAGAIQRTRNFHPRQIFVCGGGVHNTALLERLRYRLAGVDIASTAIAGIDPDMVEACTFAWLAAMRLAMQPVMLTTSSAPRALLLGGVYEPTLGIRPRP